jgi:predicted deacylase
LGDAVQPGDVLGTVVDPFIDEVFEIVAPIPGELIGMAVPQPVLSGYALFHLAWHASN